MTAEKSPPEKLGRYEILDELGKGAMGIVYLARDPLIGRQLALKTFRLGYSAGDQELEQFRTRFLREAQSAGILSHPNIVTIHDVAVDPGGDFFIAMEYVKGTDLKLVMQRQGQFEPSFAVDVVAQIADGLGYAHSKGVVHRDIKPANIIFTADKQAKITDFGIARVEASNLTMEGQLLGTPNYMAPEQIQGKEVDHRADIFSLGVMFYELLSSKKPFAAQNLSAVTHRIVYEPFPPLEEHVPGLPAGITQVLDRALAKDPEERYDKGADLAADLRAIYAPAPSATPTGAIPAASRSGSFLEGTPAASATPTGAVAPGPPPADVAVTGVVPPADSTVVGIGSATAQTGSVPDAAPAAASPATGTFPQGIGATAPTAAIPTPTTAIPTLTTAIPTAVAGPPQTGEAASGMPLAGRIAAAVGLLVAVAVIGFGIFKLVASDAEPPRVEDPEAQLRQLYLPLVEEGQKLLETGQPAAALTVFERALAIAPEDREVRRWRDQAETQALMPADTEGRLEAARAALRSHDYPTAIRVAEEILKTDPEHQEGKELLAEARDGQRRRQDIRARLRNPPQQSSPKRPTPSPTTATRPTPAPPVAVPVPPASTTLVVAFVSEVPEGTLKIFAGKTKIYDEDFKLSAIRNSPGNLREALELPVGELDLNIYVRRKGSTTRSHNIRAHLAVDDPRKLHIRLLEGGQIRVKLE